VANFDLAVAYRIYPKVAKTAMGLPFSDQKLHLSEICLRSFKQSLGDLRAKVWVLLDGCPPEYGELFRRYFEADNLVFVLLNAVGNRATFAKQIDILLDQGDSDLVYFAEDDYFYLPGQFRGMVDLLGAHPDVGFVSPYDHPDCYRLELHRQAKHLRLYAGRHWRTASSTCLTFLTRKSTLSRKEGVFRTYCRRNYDCSLWLSLTKSSILNPVKALRFFLQEPRFSKIIAKSWIYGWKQILWGDALKLWVPLPGIATHLDVAALSPGIEWPALMEQAANGVRGLRTPGEKTLAVTHVSFHQ
jgi:hypothetical protein